MSITISYWLALSLLLNVVLLSIMVGNWLGRRYTTRPLDELDFQLKIASEDLKKKSDEILRQYGDEIEQGAKKTWGITP